jgi:hypothetical protein
MDRAEVPQRLLRTGCHLSSFSRWLFWCQAMLLQLHYLLIVYADAGILKPVIKIIFATLF